MKKTLLLAAALLSVFSTVASAQRVQLTLGWGACRVNGGGTDNVSFACTTNTGNNQLVAAMIPNAASNLIAVNSGDFFVDIYSQSPVLPAWWQFSDAGTGQAGCRALGTQFTTDATNAATLTCDYTYWPEVSSVTSGSSYRYPSDDVPQQNHGKLRVIVAVDNTTAPLTTQPAAGQETYLFSARLSRGSTTGATVCAGCQTPACLTFSKADIFQSNDDNFTVVSGPVPSPLSRVTWQLVDGCAGDPTPNRNQTWGQIKAIYR